MEPVLTRFERDKKLWQEDIELLNSGQKIYLNKEGGIILTSGKINRERKVGERSRMQSKQY